IRVTLVVRPVLDASHNEMSQSHYARCSFQRMVRLTSGEMWGEPLTDPVIHQQFHDKLSKSVFLEAQKI
ncbi:MAG: hypothetical protein LBM56_02665, partial [Burkholderiaceae bacterium]|nr:hypothetical protein [Burkholderiaceae bacterium]